LKPLHRVARDQFEIVLAKAEEAPSDSKVIVDVSRGKTLQRSQPRVEIAMGDGVDRVFSEFRDQTIDYDSDLGIAQSRLLVTSNPERRAFGKRDLAGSRSVALPFSAQKAFSLERDDVCERFCLIGEVSSDSLRSGRRRGDGDHEWCSGLVDFDDLDASCHWSPMVATFSAKSMFL
jgi:hypothetical protein